jgi:hypothetical protein
MMAKTTDPISLKEAQSSLRMFVARSLRQVPGMQSLVGMGKDFSQPRGISAGSFYYSQ